MNDQSNLPADTRSTALMAGSHVRGIIPTTFEECWRIACAVAKAGKLKDVESAEQAMLCILQGAEVGLPPMMSINQIAIINGRSCIWGSAVPALAYSSGEVEHIKEGFEGEGENLKAVCKVKRRGYPEIVDEFSVADAKRARLWDTREKVTRWKNGQPAGEKANDAAWFKYPKRMLKMRARVAIRDAFPDVMAGLYIREELMGRDDLAEGDDTMERRAGEPITVPTPPEAIEHQSPVTVPSPQEEREPAPIEEPDIPAELDRRVPRPQPEEVDDAEIEPADDGKDYLQALEDTENQLTSLDPLTLGGIDEVEREYRPRLKGANEDILASFNDMIEGAREAVPNMGI